MGGQGRVAFGYAAPPASLRAWQAEDTLEKILGEIGCGRH
jgi:hypothetical protein